MRTIQPKILEIQGTKLDQEVHLERLSSFLEILQSALPFPTESCRKVKPNVLV